MFLQSINKALPKMRDGQGQVPKVARQAQFQPTSMALAKGMLQELDHSHLSRIASFHTKRLYRAF